MYSRMARAQDKLPNQKSSKDISEDDTFILLHQFRKKSQKTPRTEIEKAKSERADFLSREEL